MTHDFDWYALAPCCEYPQSGLVDLLASSVALLHRDPSTEHPNQDLRPHNGDGFGLGYYTAPALGPAPCIFTSTTPAWNNPNLSRLASKTASALIFAHVRATTEGTLSDSNCHPFSHKSLMFMHNGNIAGWREGVKRALAFDIREKWFAGVEGGTDSEWAFALFLDCLSDAGYDPDDEKYAMEGFGHAVLRKAILRTIARINAFIAQVNPEDTRSLLNFAVTDGKSVVCSRYVSSRTDEAASLYFSSGTSWQRDGEPVPSSSSSSSSTRASYPNDPNVLRSLQQRPPQTTRSSTSISTTTTTSNPKHPPPQSEFKMHRLDRGADIVLIASEPLTFERDDWVTVPTNSTITVVDKKQTVLIHPVVDDFWNDSPAWKRSGGLVESRGLARGAEGTAGSIGAVNKGRGGGGGVEEGMRSLAVR